MTQQRIYKRLIYGSKILLSSLLISAAIVSHVSAHLMVAQHGTLNFKGNGVFMVLSLPVSAFDNIDDDDDGKMSAAEFTRHRLDMVIAIKKNIILLESEDQKPLQGLMLTPVESHTDASAPTDQLIIMGRFTLNKPNRKNNSELKFHIGLFGQKDHEKVFKISVKNHSIQKRQIFALSSQNPTIGLSSK